jgi:hypothetical protein
MIVKTILSDIFANLPSGTPAIIGFDYENDYNYDNSCDYINNSQDHEQQINSENDRRSRLGLSN